MATANFYNGEAAILVQGSWAIAQINGFNPDFESKCGVFQFPGVERVIAKSDSLAMSSSTKNPEACIALMKYFTDDTAQKYTAEVGGKIPVTNVEYDASVAPAQLGYVMDVFSNATGTFGITKTGPYRLFSLTITKKHKKGMLPLNCPQGKIAKENILFYTDY